MSTHLLDTQTENRSVKHSATGANRTKKLYPIAKRTVDLVLSSLGLLLLAIPMALIALIIRLDSPGPAIFVHYRFGKGGKSLPLLKFRTMHVDAEQMIDSFSPEQLEEWEKTFKLANDPRITRIGKFLRKSSLDELPQLVNILKGELSIVGPRPITAEELKRYGAQQEKFLSVPPGLTGYWQAYARSTCSYGKRMEMELYYVENANFWWDIKIMFATVIAVFKCQGAE